MKLWRSLIQKAQDLGDDRDNPNLPWRPTLRPQDAVLIPDIQIEPPTESDEELDYVDLSIMDQTLEWPDSTPLRKVKDFHFLFKKHFDFILNKIF